MKDPARLLDTNVESFEAELLRAGRQDAPSAGARQRTLLTLGIVASGVGTGITAATTASATVGSNAVAGSALGLIGKTVGSVGGAVLAKWVVITAVGVTVVATASKPLWSPVTCATPSVLAPREIEKAAPRNHEPHHEPPSSVLPLEAPDARLETTEASSPSADASLVLRTPLDAPLISVPPLKKPLPHNDASLPAKAPKEATLSPVALTPLSSPTQEAEVPSVPAPVVMPQASLTDEVRALEGIRTAVRAQQGPHALALLNAYRAQFPNSTLSLEALVLRVDALLLTGDRPQAVKLAQRLLQQHPTGPYAARLRALVPSAER